MWYCMAACYKSFTPWFSTLHGLNNLTLHLPLFNPFNSKNRGINITSITFIYVILFHFRIYLHYVINGRRLMYYLRPREYKFHTIQIQITQQSPNWKYKKRIHSYWNIHKMCLVSCNRIIHYNSPYPTYFIRHSKVFKVLFYYFQQVCTSLKQYQALYDILQVKIINSYNNLRK